jgi:hypothetical protein
MRNSLRHQHRKISSARRIAAGLKCVLLLVVCIAMVSLDHQVLAQSKPAGVHEVPANFVTNQSLQRQFVQVLLSRAQQALEVPLDEGDTYRDPEGTLVPGTVPLLRGLIKLEPQVSASLPDLMAPLTQPREKILVSLSVEVQRLLLQPGRENFNYAAPNVRRTGRVGIEGIRCERARWTHRYVGDK